MFHTDNIEGIDSLQRELPGELQYWHKWGYISGLHYKHICGEENRGDICCVELILQDTQKIRSIKLSLFNASGKISFDMNNGFYSGLTIEDCSDRGYEKNCKFRIFSSEQDIEFEIYCEKIKAELIQ